MRVKCSLKKLNIFLIIALSICFLKAGSAYAAENAAFTSNYKMDLVFDDENKILSGTENVEIKNMTDDDLKELVFHLYADSYNQRETMPQVSTLEGDAVLTDEQKGDIFIEDIKKDEEILNFNQENQLLTVDLGDQLKPNDSIKLTIKFSLKLPEGTCRLGYYNGVYSLTNWYPILSMFNPDTDTWDTNKYNPVGESNYSDISKYNINLTVPGDFTIASTGSAKEIRNDKKEKTINLKASKVRDFAIIMSKDLKSVSKKVDGIKVNSFYVDTGKSSDKERAEQILNTSCDALKFFNKNFGRYPYKDLDIVETYCENIAMEYPQLIQMGSYKESPENTGSGDYDYFAAVIETAVHEVGHQWWYVTVGNNEFKDSFLDESLTTFSTAYYFEKTKGMYCDEGIVKALKYRYTRMYNIGFENFDIPKISSSVSDFDEEYVYNMCMYRMGALLIEDLRERCSDDSQFIDLMRTYFKKNKLKNSDIASFIETVEDKCGSETAEYIKNSIYMRSYNPVNLRLNDEEMDKICK